MSSIVWPLVYCHLIVLYDTVLSLSLSLSVSLSLSHSLTQDGDWRLGMRVLPTTVHRVLVPLQTDAR